ncbi:MAG: hypothetical protein KAI66_07350 [Lentisphaeria bacterium]|nr:hypothetical protein [Lentisphaeria bacterium]
MTDCPPPPPDSKHIHHPRPPAIDGAEWRLSLEACMRWILTLLQAVAAAVAVLGVSTLVRANSTDDCRLMIYGVDTNGDEVPDDVYLEYRVGFPDCSYDACASSGGSCHKRSIKLGKTTYQYCGCKKAQPGSGCWLAYTTVNGTSTAVCMERCEKLHCPSVAWSPTGVGNQYIYTAMPCGGCQ